MKWAYKKQIDNDGSIASDEWHFVFIFNFIKVNNHQNVNCISPCLLFCHGEKSKLNKKGKNAAASCSIHTIKMTVEIGPWDHIQCEEKFYFRKSNWSKFEKFINFIHYLEGVRSKFLATTTSFDLAKGSSSGGNNKFYINLI